MSWANWREVITRKPHTCMGCYDQIPAGQLAYKGAGLDEGGAFFHGYMCMACADYLNKNSDFWDGFCPGEIGQARKEEEEECQI